MTRSFRCPKCAKVHGSTTLLDERPAGVSKRNGCPMVRGRCSKCGVVRFVILPKRQGGAGAAHPPVPRKKSKAKKHRNVEY